ncbi:hypothetical protein T484DRAFT_1930676, partial [Baffinella frigidus]
ALRQKEEVSTQGTSRSAPSTSSKSSGRSSASTSGCSRTCPDCQARCDLSQPTCQICGFNDLSFSRSSTSSMSSCCVRTASRHCPDCQARSDVSQPTCQICGWNFEAGVFSSAEDKVDLKWVIANVKFRSANGARAVSVPLLDGSGPETPSTRPSSPSASSPSRAPILASARHSPPTSTFLPASRRGHSGVPPPLSTPPEEKIKSTHARSWLFDAAVHKESRSWFILSAEVASSQFQDDKTAVLMVVRNESPAVARTLSFHDTLFAL